MDIRQYIDAKLAELAAMGLTPADLAERQAAGRAPSATAGREMPTVREWLRIVEKTGFAKTRKTYARYWRLLADELGDRRLDSICASELRILAATAREQAVIRRSHRGGHSAEEHFVSAARRFFRLAVEDELLDTNVALKVQKPRRLDSRREALSRNRLAEVWQVVTTTGDDVVGDALVLRTFLETGCRRSGLLSLTTSTSTSTSMSRASGCTRRTTPSDGSRSQEHCLRSCTHSRSNVARLREPTACSDTAPGVGSRRGGR